MNLSSLGFSRELNSVFGNNDFDLYPHQEEAIRSFRDGNNIILSVPTASGKTLVAYAAILDSIMAGRKAVYVVPLKALAMEKFRELKILKNVGLKVRMAIGDYDEGTSVINNSDVIICTSEKFDSLLRHDPSILYDIGLVVADETHLLQDPDRGPTLEFILTMIKHVNPDIRLVCLSATMVNHSQISEWLDSVAIVSDFRPVPLTKAIAFRKSIIYSDGRTEKIKGDELDHVIRTHVSAGGQVLIFVNSRKRTLELAERYSGELSFPGRIITEESEEEDFNDEKIRELASHGYGFHHAGLSAKQRALVEEMFSKGEIKVLFATPTLAAGVNLPARAVYIRDISRYSNGYSDFISNMEIEQMLGRAGRPAYDREGYAYIYASTEKAFSRAQEAIHGLPDPIESQLGHEGTVRKWILPLVCMGICRNIQEIESFFSKTLYSQQNPVSNISAWISVTLDFLVDNDFLNVKGSTYYATSFGSMVSELYIDPVSALILRDFLRKEYSEDLALFHICKTPDMLKIPYKESEFPLIDDFLEDIGINAEEKNDLDAAKTAIVLKKWINEVPVKTIEEEFSIGYGDIQSRTNSADWISYSLSRMSMKFKPEIHVNLENLNFRIREGVREDVISLTLIPEIGRVRARRLYLNGFRTINDLASADEKDISKIYGFSEKLSSRVIRYARSIKK